MIRKSRNAFVDPILACALFLCSLYPSLSAADTVGFKYKGGIGGCSASGLHGAVDANVAHDLTTGAAGSVGIGDNVHWKFFGSINETNVVANVNNDKVVLDCQIQHISNPPPHAGEPAPNPKKPAVGTTIEAGKNNVLFANNPNEPPPVTSNVDHGSHRDILEARFVVLVNANNKDIDSYVANLVALHGIPIPNKKLEDCGGTLTSTTLAATVFGGTACLFDEWSGRFDLAINVSSASIANLISASIRQGSPTSPGPIIHTISTTDFQDVTGLGMTGQPDEFVFPSPYMNDLINGNTFVELVMSGGTLAGSLTSNVVPEATAAPALSHWGAVILALVILALGILIMARRRHWAEA